ncbi:MAG TPA: glycosyltransferase family 39 protein, partial [Terriglobia bacterium]|nr:glycosyltransferase family 39 protein [Terriglobia bacterium]
MRSAFTLAVAALNTEQSIFSFPAFKMSKAKLKRHIPIFLAIGFFLVCSLIRLDLPGLHYDEVFFANAALPGDDGTFIEWSLSVAGRRVPLMLMHYVGAVKAYLYAPIFALFGASPTTVRLPAVFLGSSSVLLLYLLAKTMFTRRVALAAMWLLASDPTFIFATRLDWGPLSIGFALKLVALYLLWRWLQEGRLSQLRLAAFALGVGVFDKVVFLWFLLALLIASPLCLWRQVRQRLSWRAIRTLVVWMLLGALPFVAYNLRERGRTFRQQPVLNRQPLETIPLQYSLLKGTLDGTTLYHFIHGQSLGDWEGLPHPRSRLDSLLCRLGSLAPHNRTCGAYGLAVALGLLPLFWFLGRLRPAGPVGFVVLLFALMVVFIALTPRATGLQHSIVLYPLPHLLISIVALCCLQLDLPQWPNVARMVKLSAAGAVASLLLSHVTVNARYLTALAQTGGLGRWSDAIYELAHYTRE